MLWVRLRKRFTDQPAWRRQHPFHGYVLDFYCPMAKLVVEIDDQSHFMGNNPQKDIARNEFIKSQNLRFIRIAAKTL